MNEHRMSPSGVNTSGIDSLLKMGSTNNAAGALTEGSLNVIEAELKAQNYQLDAASEFAEVGANIMNSQLKEVGDQAQQQKDGDSESAWGEIGGGIFGLTTSVGGLGAGTLSFGRDSDELKELDEFKGLLYKNPTADVTAQLNPVSKSFDEKVAGCERQLKDNLDQSKVLVEQISARENEIKRVSVGISKCEEFSDLSKKNGSLVKEIESKEAEIRKLAPRGTATKLNETEEKQVKLLREENAKLNAKLSEEIGPSCEKAKRAVGSQSKETLESDRDKLNKELEGLKSKLQSMQENKVDLEKELSQLKKQKALYEKLTKPVMNDSGKPELDLSNLNQYDKETQEAVLKGMSTEERARLRTHFDRAYARASKASQEERSRKWQMAGSLAQMVAQPGMGVAQGMGQMKGLGDHMAATNYGAIAQVDGTLGGQYTQAASSKASEADSNLRTALQVAQSIRG